MYPLDFGLLRALTWRRALNIVKTGAGYAVSVLFRRVWVWGEPVVVSIEPTNLCNMQCPQCPTGTRGLTRRAGSIDMARYVAVIDQIHRRTLMVLLYFQGEPTLHKEFPALVAYARARGLYVVTSTNAHFFQTDAAAEALVRSGLNALIVAVDGATEGTYRQYRVGGSLTRAVHGVRRVMDARRRLRSNTPRLYLQFLVMRHNEHEIPAIRALGRELGVDRVLLKSPQFYEAADAATGQPTLPAFQRYAVDNGTLRLRGGIPNRCKRLWLTSVVTWDGQVAPCCFDKDAHHRFGTLANGRLLRDILRAGPARAFRRAVLTDRAQIAMCRNCTEGVRVFGKGNN